MNGRLREEGVPIPDRPAAALRRSAPPGKQPPDPHLGDRIRQWYERRYQGQLQREREIKNDTDLNDVLEAIDAELQAAEVPIPGRPIAAVGKLCQVVKEELPLTSRGDPAPGKYTGEDLVRRMFAWFDARYGDRLLISDRIGNTVIAVRGDPWSFRLPLIFGGGTIRWVCEPGHQTTLPRAPALHPRGMPAPEFTYNVFDSAPDLPDQLIRSLDVHERREILDAFILAMDAFEALRVVRDHDLIDRALGDLEAAVSHLLAHRPQPGLSKWASLQAVEKVLKRFLESRSVKYPRHHQLGRLADLAESHGLATIDRSSLSGVDCAAGVRYDEQVRITEAVAAHRASLRVILHVAPQI